MKPMLCVGRGRSSLRCFVLFSFLTLTLSLSFVLRLGGTDLPSGIIVRVGKTVEITASYNYCWYPTVHRFSTGEILTTMRMSPDETSPEGEFSAYCLSKDGGETWSRRYPMGAGANIDAAYTQVPREDGAIWVLGAGYALIRTIPSRPENGFSRYSDEIFARGNGSSSNQRCEDSPFRARAIRTHNTLCHQGKRCIRTQRKFLTPNPTEQLLTVRAANGSTRSTAQQNAIHGSAGWF